MSASGAKRPREGDDAEDRERKRQAHDREFRWTIGFDQALIDFLEVNGVKRDDMPGLALRESAAKFLNDQFSLKGEKATTSEIVRNRLRTLWLKPKAKVSKKLTLKQKGMAKLAERRAALRAEIRAAGQIQEAPDSVDLLSSVGRNQVEEREDGELSGDEERKSGGDDDDSSHDPTITLDFVEKIVEQQLIAEEKKEHATLEDHRIKAIGDMLHAHGPISDVCECIFKTEDGQRYVVIFVRYMIDTKITYMRDGGPPSRRFFIEFLTETLPPSNVDMVDAVPRDESGKPRLGSWCASPSDEDIIQRRSYYQIKTAGVNMPTAVQHYYGHSSWFIAIPLPNLGAREGPIPRRGAQPRFVLPSGERWGLQPEPSGDFVGAVNPDGAPSGSQEAEPNAEQ